MIWEVWAPRWASDVTLSSTSDIFHCPGWQFGLQPVMKTCISLQPFRRTSWLDEFDQTIWTLFTVHTCVWKYLKQYPSPNMHSLLNVHFPKLDESFGHCTWVPNHFQSTYEKFEPEGWNVLDPDWPQISPKAEEETMVAGIPPYRNENVSAHSLVLFQLWK